MRVAIIQNNPIVGDIERNLAWILKTIEANLLNHELFVLPELALIGYPPRDLLSQPQISVRELLALADIKKFSKQHKIAILIGHTEMRGSTGRGAPFYNAATLFDSGDALVTVRKQRLPNYDVFDEPRFFEAWTGPAQNPIHFRGLKVAIAICEDSWDVFKAFGVRDLRRYERNTNPAAQLNLSVTTSIDLLINLSASPFSLGKAELREDLFKAQAARLNTSIVYANTAGAQDHLLFDGRSFAVNTNGDLAARAQSFQTDCLSVDLKKLAPLATLTARNDWQDLYDGLTVGIHDFVQKCGGKKVLIGLSGGIDSALVACLATSALGAENVTGVLLPSKFNSSASTDDALALAKNLGIEVKNYSIQNLVNAASDVLSLDAKGLPYENLQSRSRGLLLMAIANQTGALLLSTGNKSELAMGYSTLYGDMCGALMPIGDLYKTEVYGLAHYIDLKRLKAKQKLWIPEFTLSRAPSAELAEDQKDSDSLPPYEILDAVLFDLIENQGSTLLKEESWNKLLANGAPGARSVQELRKKMHRQEFKRYQAPPILRIHQRSFASGWNFPVAKGDL